MIAWNPKQLANKWMCSQTKKACYAKDLTCHIGFPTSEAAKQLLGTGVSPRSTDVLAF